MVEVGLDGLPDHIEILSYGISYDDYLDRDKHELACMIRAAQLKERRYLQWLRWTVASIITPHYKKGVNPTQLFKFPDEDLTPKEKVERARQDKEIDDKLAQIWQKEFGK